jgi:tyrosine-protein kinase Etk/Wzc
MTANKNLSAAVPPTETKTDLLDVLRTLFRWKRIILLACLIAAGGSAVIVLLLPVYYQATTVFYATSPDQATPELLFGDGGLVPQLYGNENDIDRIMTISESDDLVDFLVDSFHLFEHYNLAADNPRSQYNVRRYFRGLYDITKSKRDAIQLSIEDQDPTLAAAIARAAREKINRMSQDLIKNSQRRAIAAFEWDILAKEEQIGVLSDTLQGLRQRFGIYNTEAQSESLTSLVSTTETNLVSKEAKLRAFQDKGRIFRDSVAVYEVSVAGLQEELKQLNLKLERFNDGLPKVLLYTRQYQQANTSLSEDKEKIKQYQATYNATIPAIMLVEDALPPVVKSRPFRTLLVVAAILVTFLFTVIGILLFEAYRDVDWKAIYQGQ